MTYILGRNVVAKRWPTVIAGLAWVWSIAKLFLEWAEHLEFISEHVRNKDWVGEAIELLEYPPGWVTTLVIASGFGLVVWDTTLLRRRPTVAAKSRLAYLPRQYTPVDLAIFQMARVSAWGKWYAAQHLAQAKMPIDEYHLMSTAASIVVNAALEGNLAIRGTLPNNAVSEEIPQDNWGWAYLNPTPDPVRIWKIDVVPCHGVDPNRISRLLSYDLLTVNARQFEDLWPLHDKLTDSARAVFLKQARQFGVDKAEIEKLSTPRWIGQLWQKLRKFCDLSRPH